jgi:hypothetical protein
MNLGYPSTGSPNSFHINAVTISKTPYANYTENAKQAEMTKQKNVTFPTLIKN